MSYILVYHFDRAYLFTVKEEILTYHNSRKLLCSGSYEEVIKVSRNYKKVITAHCDRSGSVENLTWSIGKGEIYTKERMIEPEIKEQQYFINFGKYKDVPIKDVPVKYLRWVIHQKDLKKFIKVKIEQFLNSKKDFPKKEVNIDYKKVTTAIGVRYFPLTNNEEFNLWNKTGYTSPDKMKSGYFAYLAWMDKKTLKEMPKY